MKVEFTEEDIYGQKHPIETPELIAFKLQELEEELVKLDQKTLEGYLLAKERCPQIVEKSFLLGFLRCEVFHSDLAALRLTSYWKKRIELFGSDKAFLPLTQKEAFQDDGDYLRTGFAQLVGVKAPFGRHIALIDPSKRDPAKHPRDAVLRTLWYVLHAALEDKETQQHGIILIIHPHHLKLSQFDRKLPPMFGESIKGCLPIRISVFYICHPPAFFTIVWPILKVVLGARLRKRAKLLAGKNEAVLAKLQQDGLESTMLPAVLGGSVVLDPVKWLEERKKAGK